MRIARAFSGVVLVAARAPHANAAACQTIPTSVCAPKTRSLP